jgi:3-hydroxymyristoyl/3-hydroxydecanoyl-(acyl carrier protein) dehydratase/ubiquinone/menaquinone biosynthesis C-methylase UbiE
VSGAALESFFSRSFGGISLEPFAGLPAGIFSESYFRSNELVNLYVDAEALAVLEAFGAPRLPPPPAIRGDRRSSWEWLVEKAGGSPLASLAPAERADLAGAARETALREDARLAPVFDLIDRAARGYPDFLCGRRSGTEIIFDADSFPLWERYFDNRNPLYAPFNRIAAHAARGAAAQRGARAGLRILELGAGCGSGSETFIESLGAGAGRGPGIGRYVLTDVAASFLRRGRERAQAALAEGSGGTVLECRLLDLNQPAASWGLEEEGFDLILAVNVLHAVRDLDAVLPALRPFLAPGGALVLGECLRPRGRPAHAEFVFGLVDALREVKTHPERRARWGFLTAAEWRSALERAGYAVAAFLPDPEAAARAYPECSVAAIAARPRAPGGAGAAPFDRLLSTLQQAPPAVFVEHVLEWEPMRRVAGTAWFPPGHRVFEGHLPEEPLVPGVIIIEALAQLAGLALIEEGGEPARGYLAEVAGVRFYRPVRPGEKVRLEASLEQAFGPFARFRVEASVAGEAAARETVARGTLALARREAGERSTES